MNRLSVLERRVQEGRDVDAASEYARWLSFSGLLKLLEANSQPAPLVVDGCLLESRCDELIRMCGERFKTGDRSPNLKAKELQSLHDKIDLVAGYLSRLNVPTLTVGSASTGVHGAPAVRDPEIRVLPDYEHEPSQAGVTGAES